MRDDAYPTRLASRLREMPDLDLTDLRLTRDGGANLLLGTESLTSTDQKAWTLAGLSPSLRFTRAVLVRVNPGEKVGYALDAPASFPLKVQSTNVGHVADLLYTPAPPPATLTNCVFAGRPACITLMKFSSSHRCSSSAGRRTRPRITGR